MKLRTGLLLLVVALSGCSPFGNESLIKDIVEKIGVFIPGKTSTSVISSASSTLAVPDVGAPSGYTVTHSVGDAYQQPSFKALDGTMTESGYTVFSSVSSDAQ